LAIGLLCSKTLGCVIAGVVDALLFNEDELDDVEDPVDEDGVK